MDRRAEGSPRGTDLENPREAEEDARPFNALCKRLSEDGISRKVGSFLRGGPPWTGGCGSLSPASKTQLVHAHTYTQVQMGTAVYMHTHRRVHIHLCAQTYLCTSHTSTRAHACTLNPHVHTHVHLHTAIHAYTDVCTYTCVHIHTCAHHTSTRAHVHSIHTCTLNPHVHTHVHLHTAIHALMCTLTHIHTYTCAPHAIHTCTHVHPHTHPHTHACTLTSTRAHSHTPSMFPVPGSPAGLAPPAPSRVLRGGGSCCNSLTHGPETKAEEASVGREMPFPLNLSVLPMGDLLKRPGQASLCQHSCGWAGCSLALAGPV